MKRKILIIIGAITLIAIGLFFFKPDILTAKPVPLALRTPITTIPLDDGSQVRILQIGGNSLSDGDTELDRIKGNKKSSSLRYAQINATDVLLDGVLVGLEYETEKGALLVEIQYISDKGNPIPQRTYRATYGEKNIRIEGNPSDPLHLQFELADGKGGWIKAVGPCGSERDPLERTAITFHGWSRLQKTLHFRIKHSGSKDATFTLPNPFYTPTIQHWRSDTLPASYECDDFKLTLDRVVQGYFADRGRILAPQIIFTTPHKKPKIFTFANAIEYTLTHVEFPDGGQTKIHDSFKTDGKVYFGYPFPSDQDQARFHYIVERGSAYPYTRQEATIIAEAIVSADGKSLILKKTHPTLGIDKIEIGKIEHDKDSGSSCLITLKGIWHGDKEKQHAEAYLQTGMSNTGFLVGFVNNNNHSKDVSEFRGSYSGSSNFSVTIGGKEVKKTKYTFYNRIQWFHDFKPGEHITFGLIKKQQPVHITFTVDLPPIPNSSYE